MLADRLQRDLRRVTGLALQQGDRRGDPVVIHAVDPPAVPRHGVEVGHVLRGAGHRQEPVLESHDVTLPLSGCSAAASLVLRRSCQLLTAWIRYVLTSQDRPNCHQEHDLATSQASAPMPKTAASMAAI